MNWNRILHIDVAVVLMQEADPALALAVAIEHLFAAQQLAHHLDIRAQSSSGTGGKPIVLRPVKPVPTPSIARPGASRLIVAIECAVTGSIRFDGIADAGRELDALGVLGRHRHADVDVAVEHLRIVEPGLREAVILGDDQILPSVRPRRI